MKEAGVGERDQNKQARAEYGTIRGHLGTLHIFIVSPGLSSLPRLSHALFLSTSYLEVALGQQHLEEALPGLLAQTDTTRSKGGCISAEGREGRKEGGREGRKEGEEEEARQGKQRQG